MKKILLFIVVLTLCLFTTSQAFAATIDSPTDGGTANKPVTFTGTAIPNSTIELLEDGNQIATASTDSSGDWSITTSDITEGEHDYIARNTLTAPLAIMLPHNGPSIEFKNMDNFGGDLVITLPDTDMIARSAVVRGSTFWILASGADPADGCFVYQYETAYFSLEDTFNLGVNCYGISIDVDEAGEYAVVGLWVNTTSQHVVGLLDIDSGSYSDHIEQPDTTFGGLQDTKISPDGSRAYLRYSDKVQAYDVTAGDLVQDEEFVFAGSSNGNIEVSRDGQYLYIPYNNLIYRRDAADITSTANVPPITDATVTHVAVSPDGETVLGIGYAGSYKMWEVDTDSLTVTHTTDLTQYPESVSITPDSTKYIVGDNHSSGIIYYGSLGTSAYTTTTDNPGASYYNNNSSFITADEEHFITQSDEVTLTIQEDATPIVVTFGSDTSNPITSATKAPGQTLEVSGKDFQPNSEITIELHSTPVVLKTMTASAQGTFSTTVTIPADTPLGSHQIVVLGTDVNGNPIVGTLDLTVAQLPVTGASPIGHLFTAMFLLAVGAVLLAVNRLQMQRNAS